MKRTRKRTHLKQTIKETGLTVEEVAEIGGITRQTIYAWLRGEGGNTVPSKRLMMEFCIKLRKHFFATLHIDPGKMFPDALFGGNKADCIIIDEAEGQ